MKLTFTGADVLGPMPVDISLVRTSPQTSGVVKTAIGKKECCPHNPPYNHRE